MRSFLFSSFVIIPSILCSYELEFNKSFYKSIENDNVHTNLTISVDSKEIDFINEKVEFFQDFIEEDKSVLKKNGSYNLMPTYNYKNNTKHFTGYKGTLTYSLETPKYEKLNQFMTQIIDIKNNMNLNNVKLSISNIEWIVSKELYTKNIDLMRIDSISWIKDYAKNLPDSCDVKAISINEGYSYSNQRHNKNVMMESRASMNIIPSQSKQSIVLNTNYKLECK